MDGWHVAAVSPATPPQSRQSLGGHRKVAPSSIERPDARTAPKRVLAVRHFASGTDRDGKRAFSIRAASPSFALSFPILLRSRLA